ASGLFTPPLRSCMLGRLDALHLGGDDLRHLRERETAIRRDGDGDVSVRVEQIDHPEVPEAVPRQLLVAADLPELATGSDALSGPGLSAIEGDAHRETRDHVWERGHAHEVRRVRWIDG